MNRTYLFLLLLLTLCTNGCKEKSRFAIDTRHCPTVEIKRFDRDLLQLDTTRIYDGTQKLYSDYPDFFPAYISNVLGADASDTATVSGLIAGFLTDTTFAPVNRAVLETYTRTDDLNRKLSVAYAYLQHYFPEIGLPEVYFFVSGFNLSIMMTDKYIGMGTDMYLGADYPAYQQLAYRYMVNNMKRENIIPDLVSALLFREFRMGDTPNRLLDNMLYRGKVLFLLSVCMPDEKAEQIIGYTTEQLEWCNRHERQIWASVIDQKHLFSTDVFLIRKYVNDAPFTSTLSQDSPGRVGTWLGWQIIDSYMKNNKDVSLQELMQENDYQKILENSGYRP